MILDKMALSDLSPFANHVWQSTLFTVVVWLLTLALKRNRAAVRYWLWFAASVKFLIPFSMLVSMGSQVGWRTVRATAVAQPKWSSVAENIGRPFTASAPALKEAVSPTSDPLPVILFVAWLCGFAVSIVWWIRCWRRMRVAREGAVPLVLGLPIPVLLSAALREPGVLGIRKPALLLPHGIMDRLTPAQLNAVLAHEMCHLRRHDNLTAAIHMLVEAIFWFYPLMWWIRSRLIEERECACDEEVLLSGSDAEIYAESILNVCKFYVQYPSACVSGISGADLKQRIVRITAMRLGDKLTLGRKVVLATTGIAVVAGPVLFGLMTVSQIRAQSPPATGVPVISFEVASIKPDRSGSTVTSILSSPGRFTSSGATTKSLIEFAYDVRDHQLSGGPSWISSDKYDIDAKEEDSLVEQLKQLSSDQQQEKLRLLVRSLLADRFQLRLSHETKELPIYVLVVAKNGSRLQASKPGETYSEGPKGPDGRPAGPHTMFITSGKITGQGLPTTDLVRLLTEQLRRTVLDKTGLKDKYDFTLEWTPEGEAPMFRGAADNAVQRPENTPPPDSSGPSIFSAIEEQLGLKLESAKGPVEVLVIDHVEKPSEN